MLQRLDYRLARQIPLCSQDLFLPDAPSLYGRLLLCVLDMGLDGIADEVAHFVSQAVEASKRSWFMESSKL